ncbi:MAG: S41 family peptidase [Alistipes sp.]|nr:S41 family peptidase [Alistipes sp.]
MKRLLGACVLLLLWGVGSPALHAQALDEETRNLQKLVQFYRYLNGTYVDTVHNKTLVEGAIREMLTQLDPHSTYLTAEEMKGVKETFDGSFSGIGIEFNVLRDTIIVVNVIAGGPAQKVGLQPNDRIVAVDDTAVIGIKQMEVPKLLRGPKGSQVDLRVVRYAEPRPLEFSIVRDNIPINTVDAAYKVDDRTGYIRINRFAHTTMQEFQEAMSRLGEVDALILDLRSNGGGLMDPAVELSRYFLPAGSLIVSTEGMRIPAQQVKSKSSGPFTRGKVVVLVNETSASSSEIVSGALQDWDRGLIVGRRTFGKGLVQRQFPLLDSSAVRLTVARYHTPTGRVIQRPYENGKKEAYYEAFNRRFEGADSSVVDSTQQFRTLRSGRIVYGGGGITPDVVVPMDTTTYTLYWSNLIRKGVINDFILEYIDQNRKRLEREYPSFEAFQTRFTITPQMLTRLVQMGEAKGVPQNAPQMEISAPDLKAQLKAMVAQKLWGVNEFYRVINRENDPEFAKALEVLRAWNQYGKGVSQ